MNTNSAASKGAPRRYVSLLTGALRPWLILAVVCSGFSLHPAFLHTFWTRDYLPNIAQQAATNVILAVGMTFVILTGGIDLSVGSVMALCGVALGLAGTSGTPPFLTAMMAFPVGALAGLYGARVLSARYGKSSPVTWAGAALLALLVTAITGSVLHPLVGKGGGLAAALPAALLVGVSCGLANGLVTALGRVPPFVVTLGMLTAARGLTVYATDGNSVSGLPPGLSVLGEGSAVVLLALALVLSGMVLQTKTAPGRYIQAIGANEEASRLSGLHVSLYKTLAYVISGLTAAIAAIVLTAKFRVADTGAGMGAELNAIAAVVIGGTSLSGGKGGVVGSLVGALTIAVLNSGLVLVGVRDTLQGVIIGIVIVLAVLLDQWSKSGA